MEANPASLRRPYKTDPISDVAIEQYASTSFVAIQPFSKRVPQKACWFQCFFLLRRNPRRAFKLQGELRSIRGELRAAEGLHRSHPAAHRGQRRGARHGGDQRHEGHDGPLPRRLAEWDGVGVGVNGSSC